MHCDVLVVGAGPGGSTAAYWLSRFGADVLLVDKAQFPRNKPCGDALGPGVEEMLRAMSLGEFLESSGCRYRGIHLFYPCEDGSSNDRNQDICFRSITGWTVPRYILDDALRRNAEGAGARFLGGFTAQRPLYKDGHLSGISGIRRGQHLSIHAPITIVATGANRRLLHKMGFIQDDVTQALGLRMYLPDLDEMDEYLQVYLEEEIFPGYAWVFPGPDGCANVGCGIFVDQITSSAGSQRLRSTLQRYVHNKAANSNALRKDLLPQIPQGFPLRSDFPYVPVIQTGAMVVGEAAGLVDPITGEGIYTALRSGWLASRVASFALDAGDFSIEPLKVYDDILSEWYSDYYRAARRFMSWLSQPGMQKSLIRQARTSDRVREGLEEALLEKRPAEGMKILQEAVTLP